MRLYNIDQCTFTGASFASIVWWFFELILFRYLPKPSHYWRGLLLCCLGAKIGKSTYVYPGAKIWSPWNIGAWSVVINDMLEWMVCLGNPFNPIKLRVMTYETL